MLTFIVTQVVPKFPEYVERIPRKLHTCLCTIKSTVSSVLFMQIVELSTYSTSDFRIKIKVLSSLLCPSFWQWHFSFTKHIQTSIQFQETYTLLLLLSYKLFQHKKTVFSEIWTTDILVWFLQIYADSEYSFLIFCYCCCVITSAYWGEHTDEQQSKSTGNEIVRKPTKPPFNYFNTLKRKFCF